MTQPLTPQDRAILEELTLRQNALNDLEGFRQYLSRTHHSDYQHPPAQHHQLLQQALMRLEASPDLDGLIIEMPPGSAKSTYASVHFPCWYLAKHPDHKIVAISNTTALAEDFSRRRRAACLEDDWQRLAEATIPKDNQSLANFGTSKGGSMLAVGMGSAVSGRRANLLIIDDPIIGLEQAMSASQLDKQWASYEYEYRNRLIPNGKQVIISTRWSTEDIIGRIKRGLEEGTEQRKWEILRVPMLADEADDPLGRALGERLWPQWFTDQMVEENKSDPLRWAALYQQIPVDISGTWVSEEHVHLIERSELPRNLTHLTACDLALTAGSGDYTVVLTIGLDATRNIYVLDVRRAQASIGETLVTLQAICDQFNPELVLVDDDNASKVFIEAAREHLLRQNREPLPIYKMPTRGQDKEVRAAAIRSLFMQDRVQIVKTNWTSELLHEIARFPPKSKSIHDDQIDCLSLIGRHVGKQGGPMVSVPATPKPIEGGIRMQGHQMVTTQTLNEMWTDHTDDALRVTRIARI